MLPETYETVFKDLAKLDYIVAMINQKVCDHVDDPDPSKVEVLTEVLNNIKLILMDSNSTEVH